MNRIRRLETQEQLGQVGQQHVSHWSNNSVINGISQTIIPAGSMGVTAIMTIVYAVERITAGLSAGGTNTVSPGATVNLYNVGGNTLTVTVSVGGEVSIAVSAGLDTYNVSLWLVWV